jgi:sugar (pentulose or hexulose) kinase
VFGSYGDQQCALRGAGLQRDELSLNISTGSQVSRRTTSFQPGRYQSRKYFFGDTLDTVTHLPAGRSLNVLVDLLTEVARAQGIVLEHPWETINSLVESVDDTDLEIDLAFFQGSLGNRGSIENISTGNLSVGTLFMAAFREMADNYVRISERFSSMDWKGVVLSGGLTQKAPRLRSLLKDRFSVPLRESAAEETLAGLLDIARHDTLRQHD